jgi:hypothetical protein
VIRCSNGKDDKPAFILFDSGAQRPNVFATPLVATGALAAVTHLPHLVRTAYPWLQLPQPRRPALENGFRTVSHSPCVVSTPAEPTHTSRWTGAQWAWWVR